MKLGGLIAKVLLIHHDRSGRLRHVRHIAIRLILKEPWSFFIIHFLLRIETQPELAHYLGVKEVVHWSHLLEELLVVEEIDCWEYALESALPFVLVLCLLQELPLIFGELRHLLGLNRPFPALLTGRSTSRVFDRP